MIPIEVEGTFGEFSYRGKTWGSVFLSTDSRMNEEDRMRFRIQIADMYLDKKDKSNVRGKGYEGMITTNGKSYLIGGFYGQAFDVRLETDHGKSNLSLLVSQYADPELN
ncbi:MAG: hypothetical protein WCX73_01275 [Candidatus Pacearchaeota archaeon]|jgi:hypothetical protein